jgi:hypothetical protein
LVVVDVLVTVVVVGVVVVGVVVVDVVVVDVDVDVVADAWRTVPLVMKPRLSTTTQFLMSHEIADQVLVARLRAAWIVAQPPVSGETVSKALSAPSTAMQKLAVGQATESSSWLLPAGTPVLIVAESLWRRRGQWSRRRTRRRRRW